MFVLILLLKNANHLISLTILDKTVEKIAYLGGIFSKLRSQPILPSPLPLEAVLLGLQKKAGSLSGGNFELGEGVFFTQSR